MNYKALAALAAILCGYVALAALVPSREDQRRELKLLQAENVALRAILARDCGSRAPAPSPAGHSLAGAFHDKRPRR